ncbi:MAG: hypothetical protein EOO20_14555 [Chryseobacterium sp.]|nr:MAG: hypothetical protein EOO20_14555 [Chryseobacterium sp.]
MLYFPFANLYFNQAQVLVHGIPQYLVGTGDRRHGRATKDNLLEFTLVSRFASHQCSPFVNRKEKRSLKDRWSIWSGILDNKGGQHRRNVRLAGFPSLKSNNPAHR